MFSDYKTLSTKHAFRVADKIKYNAKTFENLMVKDHKALLRSGYVYLVAKSKSS